MVCVCAVSSWENGDFGPWKDLSMVCVDRDGLFFTRINVSYHIIQNPFILK